MKTYNEPGRARKQCPDCGIYVHAKISTCQCEYKFLDKKDKVKPESKIYNSAGKGRKQCTCGVYIGSRVLNCPKCNNSDFKSKKPIDKVKTSDIIKGQSKLNKYVGTLVLTPAGSCPYKLESETRESILEWTEKVFLHGLENGKTYTCNALTYWLFTITNNKKLEKYVAEYCFSQGYEKGFANKYKPETSSEGEIEALLVLNS